MPADRPNLLVILTDQQSSTMMSCAGNGDLHTPAMDSLAATGVRFDRANCTNPVCVPSRFSLFNGQMPSYINLRRNEPGPDTVIPEGLRQRGPGWRLREAGYTTVYNGKEHMPCGMRVSELGFEKHTDDERDELARVSAEWLRGKPAEPFCMVTSFINPHDICFMPIVDSQRNEAERAFAQRPVGVPEMKQALAHPPGVDDATFFGEVCPGLPDNFEPQSDEPGAFESLFERLPCRRMSRVEWSIERWREYRWCYKNLTESVDAQIGLVLAALDESGLAGNTVVIFTSDHGDMGGSHRLPHKEVMYEETCRIPLIVRDPHMKRGGVVDSHLVSNGLDLIPTLCDYAGAAPTTDLPGRSIRRLVEGESPDDWREHVPVESGIGRAVVTERYKYVRHDGGANAEQLYDLHRNGGEMRNDANDPTYAAALEQMRGMFDATFNRA